MRGPVLELQLLLEIQARLSSKKTQKSRHGGTETMVLVRAECQQGGASRMIGLRAMRGGSPPRAISSLRVKQEADTLTQGI